MLKLSQNKASSETQTLMFWIACLVSTGGILYGYDIGVISGALLFIKQTIPMTDAQIGLIVGAVLGGGLIGTLLAGPIGDRYGRRFLILISSLIFILGIAFILMAYSFLLMLIARLLLGVGVGIVSVAVPLYVVEIVSAENRGKYMTFFQLLLTFGIVLAYFVDLFFTPTGNWRAMFAVVLVPALILFFGVLFLPETPRWLIAHNQIERARSILLRIRRSSHEVEEDIRLIQLGLSQNTSSWTELFSKEFWFPTLIAIAVAICTQLTGINSFLQYAPLLLKNAGIHSDIITMIGSAGIGLLNFLCTLFAITLIDTIGRRPLLLIGTLGVASAECYLGLVPYFGLSTAMSGVFSLIGLFMFIVFFAIGPGVVVWLAIAELFPTKVRGKGMALCLFFNSLASTLLATFFLPLSHTLGTSETYWLFSLFSFAFFLISYFYLPETKTKSLEEIQFQFQNKNNLQKNDLFAVNIKQ